MSKVNTPVLPNIAEGPYLSEAPRDVSLAAGEGADLIPFCLGRLSEWDVSDHSAPVPAGKG